MRITIYVVFLLLNHMKKTTCSLTVRVCGLLLMLCTPFGTAIPLSSFYPYGSAAGDTIMSSIDDGSSSVISLPTPFLFFGTSYTSIFVNNNGDLTFNTAYNGYSSQPFPIQGKALIAPFFADVDTRGTGKVWYRATNDSALLAKAVNDIQSGQNFTPSWLFIATWDHVGYYNRRTDKTNTFQCILTTDTVQSYAIFQYADGLIQWTTGDASGGVGGLGGTPAQVGCNAGNGAVNYVTVPASITPAIINITSTSNVLVPGQWIFSVQDAVPVASSPLNVSLSPVPQSPYQLSAMWSAPSVTYGNITAYIVYCNTSATQAYSEQIIGPNIPTNRSIVTGATLATVFSIGITPYTQYNCYVTANTSIGEGTPSQIMTVRTDQSTPSSPLNLSVSTVPGSPNQLSASWSPPIPKNGIITAYTVYCNMSANQTYPEQIIGPNVPTVRSEVNGTTLAVTITTGLNPYTQYNCYVTANTSVGEGTPSQLATGRTDQSTPSSPLNLSVSTVPGSPNQLSASWSPPIPKNGIITAYTVYCNTSAGQAYPEPMIGPNVPTVRSVVNGTTLAIVFTTGLTPYTQYNCYVTANTSVGEGTPSQIVTAKTDQSPPSSPLNPSVSTVPGSPNQLSASWSPPIPKNGIITAYTVYCNTSASQAYPEQIIGPNVPTVRSVVNGTTMAVIFSTGLNPYTQYACYVTANTSVGEGTPSQIVTARTDQSPPSSPLNLSVSTVPGSPNQLSASWSPPIQKNGIITAYTVYCNTSASQAYPEQVIGPNVPTVRSVVNGTTLGIIFHTGLNPYTQYDCYVSANTSVGIGTPSQIYANTTDQSLPGPVTVLKQISSTFTTVTLTWQSPVAPNGAIIGYEVIMRSIVIYNTSSTQAALSGLNISMSYNLSVVALTVKGSGQPTYIQATTSSIPLVPITLLQPLSSIAVRLFWNVTLGVPQDIILGFVVYFRSKLSVKRQSGGVQTQSFPPNATNGDINGLVPNYNDYEFSVQAILNISGQPTVFPPQSFTSLSNLTILTPAPMDQTSSHTIITALGATLATLVVVLLILMVVAVIITILVMRRKGHRIQQYNISIKQPDHVTASTELNVVENNYTMKPIIHRDRTLSF